MSRRGICIIGLTAAIVLSFAPSAHAWGPLTHVQLANEILSQLWLLPSAVAVLLARHSRFFVFGNIAADVVFAKKLSRVKQVCHRWPTAFNMLDAAESDEGRAFAMGYLSHLAADTVAHNKFLPRQMALCGTTVTFGHFYWEVRADATISGDHWSQLRDALRARYDEPERLLAAHLTATLLPFGVNRRLFKRMNMLAAARGWRRSMNMWSALSRWPLDMDILADYRAESLDCIIDVLEKGPNAAVVHRDPNGNHALRHARAQRRRVRQLRRSNSPVAHILAATVARHAPRPKRPPALEIERSA